MRFALSALCLASAAGFAPRALPPAARPLAAARSRAARGAARSRAPLAPLAPLAFGRPPPSSTALLAEPPAGGAAKGGFSLPWFLDPGTRGGALVIGAPPAAAGRRPLPAPRALCPSLALARFPRLTRSRPRFALASFSRRLSSSRAHSRTRGVALRHASRRRSRRVTVVASQASCSPSCPSSRTTSRRARSASTSRPRAPSSRASSSSSRPSCGRPREEPPRRGRRARVSRER